MRSSSRLLAPRFPIGLFLAAGIVLALDWEGRHTQAAPPPTEAAPKGRFVGGQWQRGELLYQQNCASCHRADLEGRCMAPSLRGVTRHLTDEAIVAHARKIGEKMCCARHIRGLTDGNFADIIAYFHAGDENPAVRRRADQAGAGRGCCCSR